MRPIRTATRRATPTTTSYICLSCRLKSSQETLQITPDTINEQGNRLQRSKKSERSKEDSGNGSTVANGNGLVLSRRGEVIGGTTGSIFNAFEREQLTRRTDSTEPEVINASPSKSGASRDAAAGSLESAVEAEQGIGQYGMARGAERNSKLMYEANTNFFRILPSTPGMDIEAAMGVKGTSNVHSTQKQERAHGEETNSAPFVKKRHIQPEIRFHFGRRGENQKVPSFLETVIRRPVYRKSDRPRIKNTSSISPLPHSAVDKRRMPVNSVSIKKSVVNYQPPGHYFVLAAPQARDAQGVTLHKQWGTPVQAKQEEASDEESRESLLDVLGAHRDSVEGGRVNESLNGVASEQIEDHALASPDARRDGNQDDLSQEFRYEPFADGSEIAAAATEGTSNEETAKNALAATQVYKSNPGMISLSSTSALQGRRSSAMPEPSSSAQSRLRLLHTFHGSKQQVAAAFAEPVDIPPPPPPKQGDIVLKPGGIRAQLRDWQALHANPEEDAKPELDYDVELDAADGMTNSFTRLPSASPLLRFNQEDDEEQAAMAHFSKDEDGMTTDMGTEGDLRFLNVGDLVELDFQSSDQESELAVFARRLGRLCQCFTMRGRWIHFVEKNIQYSIPGWVDKSLVEPLLSHIPELKTQQEIDDFQDIAVYEDVSVPREVSAPLVSRLVQFHTESREIYRKHAGTLDNAHNILAHDTDLRYGSLVSVASTLLQMPANKLPVTALFTVRDALYRAGFAFNIDRRSHRLTGYLQIRSKEQVKMVEYVRDWLREWQDDLATRSALESEGNVTALRKHKTNKAAQYVYSFIEKAKKIILKSREDRDPTMGGSVGPSKKRFPITATSDSVRTTTDLQFTEQDTELVRFMETWSCHSAFYALPRLASLPPLILQATGLYKEYHLATNTGFMFLQELGTIMPYENRVRFDSHLLLPSSQHSKPLQNLMSSLLEMHDKYNFPDSMRSLRHDWKSMPVYCVDDASAQEIDDGLSIEPAGKGHWWVHIHIANPTAFFERDNPLAKMARHMGESIYMPERTYMMLPRWATSKHFSLGPNRPCLTFSAKLDEEGRTLECKICSGNVRNVLRLTGQELRTLLGAKESEIVERVLTVGGEPPPSRTRKSMLPEINENMVGELKLLSRLAEKRLSMRQARGGVIFDTRDNDIEVWQSAKSTGLAWDHPHRGGSRTVEGDPVIRMRTQGMQDYFSAIPNASDNMVREMMMLACETAAGWCGERRIPNVFRGTVTVPQPDGMDAERYHREVMLPATERTPNGKVPLHMNFQYIQLLGRMALRTAPLPHKIMGVPYYTKVTSPLRRYGDMIVHWQIEAALREEARTGKSLVTQKPRHDYSFLPFSPTALETIMLGLQPRELLINKAKKAGVEFWIAMLMFRAHHFGEAELPWAATQDEAASTGKPLMQVFLPNDIYASKRTISVFAVDTVLNVPCSMFRPDTEARGLEPVKKGDLWEVELDFVDVYRRLIMVTPVRLVHRTEI